MRKWIEETDVRMVPEKSMSGNRYESRNGRIFGHLNEHFSDLAERFQKFQKKLDWQGPAVISFSQLLKDQDASAVKECYSSVDWRKNKSKLIKCLEEKGVDLSKDRHLWRDSEGQLAPSTSKKSVADRLEYLGSLVEVTLELESEKIGIAGKLEDNIQKPPILEQCSMVKEQLKNYVK